MSPVRLAIGALSPRGSSARLTVTIFHRVLREPDPLFPEDPDAARFDALLALLRRWFNVIPLGAAIDALEAGSLPARPLCVTFDDGYRDNLEVALPLLRRHDVPATFFIASGYLDGGRMWNDTVIEAVRHFHGDVLDLSSIDLGVHRFADPGSRRIAIDRLLARLKYLSPNRRDALSSRIAEIAGVRPSDELMMTSEQVLALRRAGMDIGAHTATHPILARIGLQEARLEMSRGKARLEEVLDERVTLFAYPNGKPVTDYAGEHVRIARELGFRAAVSTAWGVARSGCDVFQIPRFTPWDRASARIGVRFLQNLLRTSYALSPAA